MSYKKMTAEERDAEKKAYHAYIRSEYGDGPAVLTKDMPGTYQTNIAGIPWYFNYSSEYKALKKQIGFNRKKRRE